MMHKYLVFDLDGTLAPIGQPTPESCTAKLKRLEEMGHTLIICSGKSSDYLSGYARQLPLENPVLISENGSTLCWGRELPPSKYTELQCLPEEEGELHRTVDRIRKGFGHKVWLQPNRFAIDVFASSDDILDKLQEMFDENAGDMTHLVIHRHADCFDVLPKSINKRTGLEYFCREEKAEGSDFVAVGDSPNDRPMFDFADVSVSIGESMRQAADHNFNCLEDALDFITEMRL